MERCIRVGVRTLAIAALDSFGPHATCTWRATRRLVDPHARLSLLTRQSDRQSDCQLSHCLSLFCFYASAPRLPEVLGGRLGTNDPRKPQCIHHRCSLCRRFDLINGCCGCSIIEALNFYETPPNVTCSYIARIDDDARRELLRGYF